MPDLIFIGTKRSDIQMTTTSNKAVRLYTASGLLLYTVKLTATLSCPMILNSYPADVELCHIGMESFSYNNDELKLIWDDGLDNASSIIHDSIDHLTKFELRNLYKRNETHAGERPNSFKSRLVLYLEG